MNTINDIQFNENLFSQFDSLIIILYQIEGVGLAIPLKNLELITFIRPFDGIPDCQNHIITNHQNTFTLFAYSDNIETWFWNNNIIPDNLDDIIIFCPFPGDKKYFKDWTRRYTGKVKNIVTYDQLEREILLFGMRFINDLSLEFGKNQQILDLFNQHHERMRLALINSFDQAINGL